MLNQNAIFIIFAENCRIFFCILEAQTGSKVRKANIYSYHFVKNLDHIEMNLQIGTLVKRDFFFLASLET